MHSCRAIYKVWITLNFLQNNIFYNYASLQSENKTCLSEKQKESQSVVDNVKVLMSLTKILNPKILT